MNDTKSASLVLVAGAAGVAWWWYHITQGKLAAVAAQEPAPGGAGPTLGKGPSVPSGGTLDRLTSFAQSWGLTVTSGLRPGDTHSLHSEGRAIDVGVPAAGLQGQIEAAAARQGIHVLKEGYGPGGGPYRSTAPHWHLSFPRIKNGRLVW